MSTADNTQGYTQDELARLNQELETRLGMAALARGDGLTDDETQEISTAHADDVARR